MADYRQILRECAERLISTADRLTVNGSNTSQANRGSNAGASQDCEPSALEEHRRIFGYRPPVGSVQSARSSNSRGKRGGSSPYFIPRNTWTRSFVCLAKKDSRSAPSSSERIALSAAELGEKKIVFHKCGNSTHVHEKITEAFPALASAGGYEILRIADYKSKNLMEIPMSGSGYSVSYLKGTLGQAKAYIRPIQKDLSLEVSNAIKVRTCNVSAFHKAHTVIKHMLRGSTIHIIIFFFLPFKEESPLVNSCQLPFALICLYGQAPFYIVRDIPALKRRQGA